MLSEDLKQNDLRLLVDDTIEIDSYATKMGDDKDIITIAFTVKYKEAADDLIKFVEQGYKFVLNAEPSTGELMDSKYKVFVEIQRTKEVPAQIAEMLYGISRLADIKKFKFRYYKSFKIHDATVDNLASIIPLSSKEYKATIENNLMENYEAFFHNSLLESVEMDDDVITFKRVFRDPIRLKYLKSGSKNDLLESITDKIKIEPMDMAEILFLTKYIGNYNITKFGKTFMLESNRHAILTEFLP